MAGDVRMGLMFLLQRTQDATLPQSVNARRSAHVASTSYPVTRELSTCPIRGRFAHVSGHHAAHAQAIHQRAEGGPPEHVGEWHADFAARAQGGRLAVGFGLILSPNFTLWTIASKASVPIYAGSPRKGRAMCMMRRLSASLSDGMPGPGGTSAMRPIRPSPAAPSPGIRAS